MSVKTEPRLLVKHLAVTELIKTMWCDVVCIIYLRIINCIKLLTMIVSQRQQIKLLLMRLFTVHNLYLNLKTTIP